MEDKSKLLLRLEAMKKELAAKSKKLEKSKCGARVKAYVRQRIKEQNHLENMTGNTDHKCLSTRGVQHECGVKTGLVTSMRDPVQAQSDESLTLFNIATLSHPDNFDGVGVSYAHTHTDVSVVKGQDVSVHDKGLKYGEGSNENNCACGAMLDSARNSICVSEKDRNKNAVTVNKERTIGLIERTCGYSTSKTSKKKRLSLMNKDYGNNSKLDKLTVVDEMSTFAKVCSYSNDQKTNKNGFSFENKNFSPRTLRDDVSVSALKPTLTKNESGFQNKTISMECSQLHHDCITPKSLVVDSTFDDSVFITPSFQSARQGVNVELDAQIKTYITKSTDRVSNSDFLNMLGISQDCDINKRDSGADKIKQDSEKCDHKVLYDVAGIPDNAKTNAHPILSSDIPQQTIAPLIHTVSKPDCPSTTEYTELDVIPYSQFELIEDFLTETPSSQTDSEKYKRKHKHAGSLIKRKSPRLSSNLFNSKNSHGLSAGSFANLSLYKKSQQSLTAQRKAIAVMSIFQLLVDEAKKKTHEDFQLPHNFSELMEAKARLSCPRNDEESVKMQPESNVNLLANSSMERKIIEKAYGSCEKSHLVFVDSENDYESKPSTNRDYVGSVVQSSYHTTPKSKSNKKSNYVNVKICTEHSTGSHNGLAKSALKKSLKENSSHSDDLSFDKAVTFDVKTVSKGDENVSTLRDHIDQGILSPITKDNSSHGFLNPITRSSTPKLENDSAISEDKSAQEALSPIGQPLELLVSPKDICQSKASQSTTPHRLQYSSRTKRTSKFLRRVPLFLSPKYVVSQSTYSLTSTPKQTCPSLSITKSCQKDILSEDLQSGNAALDLNESQSKITDVVSFDKPKERESSFEISGGKSPFSKYLEDSIVVETYKKDFHSSIHSSPYQKIFKTPSTPLQIFEKCCATVGTLSSPIFTPSRTSRSKFKAENSSDGKSFCLKGKQTLEFKGCFQSCSEDAVVQLLHGSLSLEQGGWKRYMVSIQASALTVWIQEDSNSWSPELDWRLSSEIHILHACVLPVIDKISIAASGWEKNQHFVTVFVYDISKDDTFRFNIPNLDTCELRTSEIQFCVYPLSCLLLGISNTTHHSLRKIKFQHSMRDVASTEAFETLQGKLNALTLCQGQDSACITLTWDQKITLWNTLCKVALKTITIPSDFPCLTDLISVKAVKGLLLFTASWRVEDTGDSGGTIILNPMTGRFYKTSTVYNIPNAGWRSTEKLKKERSHLFAVSSSGSVCWWESKSGEMVGYRQSNMATCVAAMDHHLAIGEIHGCVHLYSCC